MSSDQKTWIYADHAASAPLCPAALHAMLPWLTDEYANASALHGPGRRARKAVETARRQIAACLGARAEEIRFTSGGTESDNWAITGTAKALAGRGRHIVTTSIEHPAVKRTCLRLAAQGFEVTSVNPGRDGIIRPADIEAACRPDTVLISCMAVNHETGAVQPMEAIAEIASRRGIRFHSDMVQAAGKIPLDLDAAGVSLAAFSAHKFGGPKGVGILYIRKDITLPPLLSGGEQEWGLRPGTENVAGIAGTAAALEWMTEQYPSHSALVTALREELLDSLPAGYVLNGAGGIPEIINLRYDGVNGEELTLRLDLDHVAISTGSACTSGDHEPSPGLTSMGLSDREALSSVRISIGPENTPEQMRRMGEVIRHAVTEIRRRHHMTDRDAASK